MKYLKKYEGFDIKEISYEEEQFKKLAKSLDPNNYNAYYNIYKRKGLEAARKVLMDKVEAQKTFDKEIKRMKRYDKQTKNDFFGIAKDDVKFYAPIAYAPIAKETKELIKETLLNNKTKKQFYKLGIRNITGTPDMAIPNFLYDLKVRKDSYELNFGLDNKQIDNKIIKLGDSLQLIETSLYEGDWLSDFNEKKDLFKVIIKLNKIQDSYCRFTTKVLFNSRVNFNAHFGKFVENEIYCKISHSISGYPFIFSSFEENFEMDGKIHKMNKEEAVDLRKDIFEFISKNFKKCASYIQNNMNFSKFNEFRDKLIVLLYSMVERSDDYFDTIKTIKDNFPLTWELMRKEIPEEAANDTDDLIDMGF